MIVGQTVRMTDWTTPGVYPVAPGVHRIPLPLPNDGLRAVRWTRRGRSFAELDVFNRMLAIGDVDGVSRFGR